MSDMHGEGLVITNGSGAQPGMFVDKVAKKFKNEDMESYRNCQFFQFSIVLTYKTYDLVAVGIEEFKKISKAFEALISMKTQVKRLIKKIVVV